MLATTGKKNVLITTIGLAIHSLADGAALGASLYLESFGESQGLGMIIFIAIMLQKVIKFETCRLKHCISSFFLKTKYFTIRFFIFVRYRWFFVKI